MQQELRNGENSRQWPWVTGAAALILILWLSCWLLVPRYFPNMDQRGQFGDMFGVVNALFAGLAFAGIIWAIILQKNELELQRKELAETRKEIAGQTQQLKAQARTLKEQNFENSFFQLLRFHIDIVDSLNVVVESRKISGRECFKRLLHQVTKLQNNDESRKDLRNK